MGYQIRAMSFAEILDTGFRVIRDHFWLLVGTAAILDVPLAVLSGRVAGAGSDVAWGLLALTLILAVVGPPLVLAAITFAVGEIYLGRTTTIGQSLRAALSIMMPMVGTMLLYYLGVIFGFVLLIVPGIYLLLAWLLVWQVMVLERRYGTAALRRSRELMRGSFLRAAGLLIVSWLIGAVLGGVLELALGYIPVVGPVAAGLAQAVGLAYGATIAVILYFDVRSRREAFDLEHLARLVEGTEGSFGTAPAAG